MSLRKYRAKNKRETQIPIGILAGGIGNGMRKAIQRTKEELLEIKNVY